MYCKLVYNIVKNIKKIIRYIIELILKKYKVIFFNFFKIFQSYSFITSLIISTLITDFSSPFKVSFIK